MSAMALDFVSVDHNGVWRVGVTREDRDERL